ncbi:maintenance of ploidy protein mob1 [Ogataea parapolymorpha DL-1]|uniref:Maintenance of ploidy protein mob1 n=1 Tax=Ogataea parapolymorpha (strain ATCC 26012 / BCRC 20466 / JCM 22074 / NRRL Y-7560 / DL-1) TaxID=871575 RepID=W1Q711_OGAPD|nr:maintenance of ploidy protein mob1 [Ogataea parapolymorpha DL-1]ESW96053.1 maintenance of ploidy protein mob1 [Ogataea parapolymorpha DL-1]
MSFIHNHFNSSSIPTIRSARVFRRNPESGPASPNTAKLQTQPVSYFSQPQQTQHQVSNHKEIRSYAEQTLGSGSALAQAVKLPLDEDLNEWLAVHVVDFYNQVNMLYGTITEFCSPITCPRMIATQEYEYLWQDPMNRSSNKPTSMSAPGYVEALMVWIQGFLDDDSIFPTKMGVGFPKQFPSLVRTIMKRLFRVYAHMYCHHFDEINELGLQTHLNTSLKHFVLFCSEFHILTSKDYGPLDELVSRMLDDRDRK